MSLLAVFVVVAAVLLIAYRLYGRVLSRLARLDPDRATPATELRDDSDYIPTETKFLIGQHFSAIAAAGPIVGPILAGMYFGWGPAILWIVLGAILIGGVHDFMALVASIRHKARSIAEVVRDHMGRPSYLLFLSFIWFALVYIIVAFTDITAAAFVGTQTLENGQSVKGPGIATSSMLYLAIPILMGLLLRFTKLGLGWATVIFLPLVGLAVVGGQHIPMDLAAWFGVSDQAAHRMWDVVILAYCVAAAMIPMWLLLQPRGHLGGYFLYASLAAAGIGVIFAGRTVEFPAFLGWEHAKGGPLFPILFITIACGACSGFHALIASGTTSKQLKRETDARLVGYGTMLMEAMVAVIALSCVMMFAQGSSTLAQGKPNFIYAAGMGAYLQPLGIAPAIAVAFALMAFTTFVYDTLDVCTRLGRYIIQELTGWKGRFGAFVATTATAGVPLAFLIGTPLDPTGTAPPAWQKFWALFGASNQLLAALTLLGITVWLWRTRRAIWVWLVTGLPTVWMYGMSVWALGLTLQREAADPTKPAWTLNPVVWIGGVLLVLAGLMAIAAIAAFFKAPGAPTPEPAPAAGS